MTVENNEDQVKVNFSSQRILNVTMSTSLVKLTRSLIVLVLVVEMRNILRENA